MRPVAAVLCSLAVVGCGDGPGPDDEVGAAHFQFALAAFGGDTTPERVRSHDCLVFGFFQVPLPVETQGTVRFPITIHRNLGEQRGTHLESTSADSTVGEAVLEYSGLGDDSLQFTLGAGPYTITLGPGSKVPSEPNEYAGDWTCGPDVPLANDSTLLAYGFDSDLELAGTWRVSELVPFE